jgi:predicted DNA repair protein MutK
MGIMASSLLLLLDDITSVLDDVATLTKVAAKKTAGVIGDDLALNAKQVTGVHPARELPVVFAVARGSTLNKLILVPAALAISWLAPWAITPLLVAGGVFLCYEGVEKLLHRVRHGAGSGAHGQETRAADAGEPAAADIAGGRPEVGPPTAHDPVAERTKIRGAVRTDFILSAEIIVIALGVVAGQPFLTQLGVLAAVAAAMTIGVYGLVAAIVKLDDLGLALAGRRAPVSRALGRGILAMAPWLMRGLAVAGTAAMFLVGGGIVVHAVPAVHHAVAHAVEAAVAALLDGGDGDTLVTLGTMAAEAAVGIAAGCVAVGIVAVTGALRRGGAAHGMTA